MALSTFAMPRHRPLSPVPRHFHPSQCSLSPLPRQPPPPAFSLCGPVCSGNAMQMESGNLRPCVCGLQARLCSGKSQRCAPLHGKVAGWQGGTPSPGDHGLCTHRHSWALRWFPPCGPVTNATASVRVQVSASGPCVQSWVPLRSETPESCLSHRIVLYLSL